jgi:hypothetical protein
MTPNALHCLKYLDAKSLFISVTDEPIICWVLNFQCVRMVIDAVTGCLQTTLKDLLSTARLTWESEFKADLVSTSVTQFHILAINQCTP